MSGDHAAAAPAAAIDVHDLGKRFGRRTALEGLTLQVAPGEVVALLGPNGAGKTTTLRLLAGLQVPTTGGGTVAGTALGTGPARGVGLLTEVPGLWDRLTVEMNLLTYARLHGVDDPAGRVHGVLQRFHLEGRVADRAGTLSKGLRQRVALARAFLADPAVLLLDEPTSGLDPAAARAVRDVIAEARAAGVAVLLSTHRLDEAEALADRVAILQQRLRALDSPGGLRRRLLGAERVAIDIDGDAAVWRPTLAPLVATLDLDGRHRVTATLAPGVDVPAAVAALVGAGARVRGVHDDRPSLEAAYLSLVEHDG
ncbi:MAG: ABC transporter ATP-binding protein [Vicinamibacterales bacterium]